MRKQTAGVLLVFGAVLTVSACGVDDSSEVSVSAPQSEKMSWEEFKATAIHEVERPGFIVDGDIYVSDEAELYDFYNDYLAQDKDALTVNLANGVKTIWNATDRNRLTYCVSNAFDTDSSTATVKSKLVQALDAAARSWDARIGVKFIYDPTQDATCTSRNTRVMFNVGLVNASYFASAFFPNNTRASRQLLVTAAAFTTTAGGRDLQGIMTHELGHVLGFRHEHIWLSPACTSESTANAQKVTAYDVNSVMHYPQCRPSATGGYRPSARDYEGAISLYGAK